MKNSKNKIPKKYRMRTDQQYKDSAMIIFFAIVAASIVLLLSVIFMT